MSGNSQRCLSLTQVPPTAEDLWHMLPCFCSWKPTATRSSYEVGWCTGSLFLWAWCKFEAHFSYITYGLTKPSLCGFGRHKAALWNQFGSVYHPNDLPLLPYVFWGVVGDRSNIENSCKSYGVPECRMGENGNKRESDAKAAWVVWAVLRLSSHNLLCAHKLKSITGNNRSILTDHDN